MFGFQRWARSMSVAITIRSLIETPTWGSNIRSGSLLGGWSTSLKGPGTKAPRSTRAVWPLNLLHQCLFRSECRSTGGPQAARVRGR